MNRLRLVFQWSTFNRAKTNLNKSTYVARRSFTSHHSYFSLLQPCRKHQKYIAQIMLASYLSMPGVLLAQGVSAAANSVHAPGFDTAANGTPIVNINAPSSKGVSRNEYNELNVDTKGLIFNNATDIVNTQLAGFIDGNSRLNGNSANIILNEVKGNSRSALNGYMEIAGRSAELVIANQNGITCNGCGFINTTRGTLTTGLPTFDGAGGLTGFDVSRGDVDISGLGLNASNVDEVDILARSVSLNSKFWAKNATIVTGQNHINYQNKKVQDKKVTAALGSSGSGISLDVAAIGGMYANRIRLIGTEKGLGVNVAGEIKAVEDMTLDSQGNLSNSGTISAKTLAISSKGINNTGNMLGNSISIDADLLDNHSNTANIQAVNSVSIKLKDELKNRDGARVLSKDGLISIESGSVSNQSMVAANRIELHSGSLTNNTSDGQIISSGRLDLTLTGNANNTDGAMIHADKVLTLNASGDLVNTDSTIETVDTAIINSRNLTSSGTILAEKGTLTVKTNKVDNQGILAGNGITINATDLKNSTAKGKILSSDTLDLTLTGNANNTDGAMIHADKALALNASGDLVNTDSTIETIDTAIINSRNLTSSGTILAEKGTLTVKTNKVDNQGILAGNGITINATDLKNSTAKGKILSSDTLDLTLTGNANNTDGAMIHADKTLTLNASGDLTNTDASIESTDSVNLNSSNIYNSVASKVLAQNNGLTIQTNTLDNHGSLSGHGLDVNAALVNNNTSSSKILSSKDLTLTTQASFSNVNGAQVKANNTLTINSQGDINNTGSLLESVNNITLNSRNLNNASTGTISAQNGTLSITNSGGSLNNQGGIAGGRVIVNAAGVSNADSSALILGRDYLDIRSTGNITNQDGAVLYSLGDGVIKAAGTLTNSSATIETAKNLAIEANQITNKKSNFSTSQNVTSQSYTNVGIGVPGGYYAARRNYTTTTTTPVLLADSNQAYILSGGNMSIMGKIDNIYSTVSAVGSLSFTSSQLNNVSYSTNKTIVSTGTDTLFREEKYCKIKVFKCISRGTRTKIDTRGYNNTSSSTVTLASATFTAGGNITGKAGSVDNKGKVDEVAKVTASKDKSPSAFDVTKEGMLKVRRDEIFGGDLLKDLVSSALFKESDSPDQKYLVETNPLFTNYQTFISSDYLLSKMLGDEAGRTGKDISRLGDGYLEQKLVRDQILSYTGNLTLPNDVDIEATYATLMDNAVEEYQGLELSTGVELSATQISQLKKPIVWMVVETVQTASGLQLALVPKVYFSNTTDMTLRSDGSLIAATNIDIDAQDGIVNSGSMLATVDLSLKGNSIGNDGIIQAGGNASVTAVDDITNSGTMQAGGTLGLVAGGNITSETKTQIFNHQRSNHSATETLVDTTATLKGNNISLSAGNNITLKGTDVSAAEQVFASAGNNFTLASLAVTNSSKDGNYYDNSNTTNQVSSLSGNNIQLKAGKTLTSEGAQINASGNLALIANNIDLLAVTDSKDNYSFIGGGGNSTEKRSHNESLTGTTLGAGGTLSLVSQQDIFSQGSTLNGGEGITLAAGGDIMLASAEAYNSSFQEVKSKSSGFWGSKSSTKTTTSESLTNLGTSLTSGGDIQLSAGADILLSGTKATAAGGIDLQAKGDIQLLSAVDQTSSRYQEQKKGTFKVKAKDQGSIKQTAVTSELIANGTSGKGNIVLTSGNNITLEGANLAANDTLFMGAGSDAREAVTKDANGNYVNADGEQVGNVTVGTQALQSSEWNESSSGFRGIFKDLVKIVAVGVAVGTGGLVHGEIKVGEADSTRTDSLTQQISTLAGNDLLIKAKDTLALIGAKISATNLASLSANDITIDAAHEQTVVSNSHTEQTVSGKGVTLQKDQISLASITETDQTERTTTTANTWQGSNISAGSLNLSANNNLVILASDINVDNNADIKAENILVGGRDATTDTTHDSITKTKTLDVGIRNAYVDVALATEALKDAKDAVSDAKNAYNDAKQKVAEGKLPASDLDFYKVNLAAATANVASATTAVTSAGAAAAASTATYGFTINGGVTTQTDTTSTTSTQGTWNGSNINVGNNANLTSNNNLNIEGSNINTAGQLALNANNIHITAGKNTYTENTESQSEGASASYGSSGGFSGGINGSKSQSDSQSVQHVNSGLSAGSIVSNSDNLTIEGGNLNAEDIDITTDKLVVTSLQDTSTSSSKSSGGSVGIGSSNNVGINASQSNADSAWVNQQSGITGGTVNITAKDTTLNGAVIAAVDEQGNSTNKLNLATGTLTVADIKDTDNSQSMGMSISGSGNTTTIGANFNGHEKAQTSKATVGLGNVTVGGTSIDEQAQFADLNRDTNNSQETTKDMERGGLDMSLTVDNRMLTEKGREEIANDVEDTYEHGEDIGRTAKTISESDDLGILNFGETLHNNAQGTQLKNDLLRNPENAHILAGLQSEDEETYAKAFAELGHLAQDKFGLSLSDINLYDAQKTDSASLADTTLVDVKGGTVVDTNNSEYGNIFVDAGDSVSKTDMVNTLGQEVLETQDLQGKSSGLGLIKNTESTQEALTQAFGSQLSDRINQAYNGELDATGGANFDQNLKDSQSVATGTQRANNVGNATVDHRQLYVAEAQAIIKAVPAYAKQHGITENEAKTQLTQQALRQVDQTWSEQIEENPQAREMLAAIAPEIGQVGESPIGRGNLDILLGTDTSKAFEAKDEATFKDTNINARETGLIEQGFAGEANFIEKYGTQNGEKTVDIGLGEAAGQAAQTIKEGATAVAEGLSQDPVNFAKTVAEGVWDSTVNAVTNPMETLVYEDSKGSAADRQLVAELQGNAEAAKQEAGSNFIEMVSGLTPPGVGKVVKHSSEVVGKEAVEVAGKQAAKKVDFVDTDGEMIGQNGATYNAVIHSSKSAEEVNLQMIKQDYVPAWTDNTVVQDVTLLPGYKLEQMVEKEALQNMDVNDPNSIMGRWAADDTLPLNQQEARNITSVKKEWKQDPNIIEVEVIEPLNVNRGSTREIYDEGVGALLPGKATQVEFVEGKIETASKVEIIGIKEMNNGE